MHNVSLKIFLSFKCICRLTENAVRMLLLSELPIVLQVYQLLNNYVKINLVSGFKITGIRMSLLQESRKINACLKIQCQLMIMYIFSSIISRAQFKHTEKSIGKSHLLMHYICHSKKKKKKHLILPYIANVTDTILKLHFIMCAPWYTEFCTTVVAHF